MNYEQRRRWILDYMRLREPYGGCRVDILNSSFVEDYVAATQSAVSVTLFGANKCPRLGNDLARMYKEGSLSRRTAGISDLAGQGFPRWVYTYRLSEFTR